MLHPVARDHLSYWQVVNRDQLSFWQSVVVSMHTLCQEKSLTKCMQAQRLTRPRAGAKPQLGQRALNGQGQRQTDGGRG